MKHDLNNNINHEESREVSGKIIKAAYDISSLEGKHIKELVSEIHPLVSNYAYDRVQKELENERFATFIKLARAFDDETLSKTINVLGYTLNVK